MRRGILRILPVVLEGAAGFTTLIGIASLDGWTTGEQSALAAGLVLAGSTIAAPDSRRRWIALGWLPLVLVAFLGLPDEAAGLVAAAVSSLSIAVALVACTALRTSAGTALVSLWCLAITAFPVESSFPWFAPVVATGGILLTLALSEAGSLHPAAVAIAMLVCSLVLPLPAEAAMLPAILAAAIFAARSRSPVWGALAIATALLAGKWIAVPVAVLVVAPLAALVRRDAMVPALAAGGALHPALGAQLAAWPLWTRARIPALAGALLLVAGALVIERTWVTLVWMVTSMLVLWLSNEDGERGPAAAITIPALAATVAFSLPWSGAIPGVFPLPGPLLLSFVAAAAIALLPFDARFRTASALGLLLLTLAVASHPTPPARGQERVLRPGESFDFRVPDAPQTVEIVLRGGNVTRLDVEDRIVVVDAVSAAGASRRVLTAGDVGDWGSLRRDTIFSTRLRNVAGSGPVEGMGRNAFQRHSGRIAFGGEKVHFVRVTLAAGLPEDVRLVIESVRTWTPSS